MSDPTQAQAEDPLRTLHSDILAQRARILKLANITTQGLTVEMANTVLSIVGDVVVAMSQMRDGLELGMDDAFGTLDDRITAIEGESSSLTGEDADKLQALVDTCKHLATVIRQGGVQPPEVEQALTLADALANECAEIVDDARMEDDEDEEEDEPRAPQLNGAP